MNKVKTLLIALALSFTAFSNIYIAEAQLLAPLTINVSPPPVVSPPPPIYAGHVDWSAFEQQAPRPPSIYSTECCGYIRDISLPFGMDSISWMDNQCGAVGGGHLWDVSECTAFGFGGGVTGLGSAFPGSQEPDGVFVCCWLSWGN